MTARIGIVVGLILFGTGIEPLSASDSFPVECSIFLPIAPENGANPDEVIYESKEGISAEVTTSRFEMGNEIDLAGTARLLTDFHFAYFEGAKSPANRTVRLRLYLNDGPNEISGHLVPMTLIYDSGILAIEAGLSHVAISNLALPLPKNRLTWTVQFNEAAPFEPAGLIAGDPVVGTNGKFVWKKQNREWSLTRTSGGGGFQARLLAKSELRVLEYGVNGLFAFLKGAGAKAGKLYILESKADLTPYTVWKRIDFCGSQSAGGLIQFTGFAGAFGRSSFLRVLQTDAVPGGD
jgi:hypothetical protein